MKIGNGFDVHRFAAEPPANGSIRLGGVDIAHDRAIIAHSDGDVLIHALCDAMLGALALGDIGHHFPDTDAGLRGINSLTLLKRVGEMLEQQGASLGNADLTVITQTPKLAPHITAMRESLAACLKCDIQRISIKATTTEGLGFTGRGEGIGVLATVLLNEH